MILIKPKFSNRTFDTYPILYVYTRDVQGDIAKIVHVIEKFRAGPANFFGFLGEISKKFGEFQAFFKFL